MNMPHGTSQSYLTDNFGFGIALVDTAGNRTATYAPYGATRLATGAKENANLYRYTGKYQDTDTGLYKLDTCFYDPQNRPLHPDRSNAS